MALLVALLLHCAKESSDCSLTDTPVRLPALRSHIAQMVAKASQLFYSSTYVMALLCQTKHVLACITEATREPRLVGRKAKVHVHLSA